MNTMTEDTLVQQTSAQWVGFSMNERRPNKVRE